MPRPGRAALAAAGEVGFKDEQASRPEGGPQRREQPPVQEERVHDYVVLPARRPPAVQVRGDPADSAETGPPRTPRGLPKSRLRNVDRIDLIARAREVQGVAAEAGRDIEGAGHGLR